MDTKYNHEKILIIVALFLCAGILFYNAFFIPDISIPSVIQVNSESSSAQSLEESSEDKKDNSSNESNNKGGISGEKININTATETELSENLTGVGAVTARNIIEYRTNVGKFNSIEDIKNVSGIGDKTFEKFKDMICV